MDGVHPFPYPPPPPPPRSLIPKAMKVPSLALSALAVVSPVLAQSAAQKVADLRLAAAAVDRIRLLEDSDVC